GFVAGRAHAHLCVAVVFLVLKRTGVVCGDFLRHNCCRKKSAGWTNVNPGKWRVTIGTPHAGFLPGQTEAPLLCFVDTSGCLLPVRRRGLPYVQKRRLSLRRSRLRFGLTEHPCLDRPITPPGWWPAR